MNATTVRVIKYVGMGLLGAAASIGSTIVHEKQTEVVKLFVTALKEAAAATK